MANSLPQPIPADAPLRAPMDHPVAGLPGRPPELDLGRDALAQVRVPDQLALHRPAFPGLQLCGLPEVADMRLRQRAIGPEVAFDLPEDGHLCRSRMRAISLTGTLACRQLHADRSHSGSPHLITHWFTMEAALRGSAHPW
ncbi:hypothetical protein [Mangrovicoccus ximenensis]|uniref:hypothetical protein n=1 Tax=Mangrovicoccus ximenensis TaxID=1911570 RepID=UPI0011AE7210|nr:hypothetical protein [Mangrovicoccus ximenensis]